jgi:hypothetical protein
VSLGILTRLLAVLRRSGSKLDAYELAIVDAVARELSPADGRKLRERARAINLVQRQNGGQYTNLYQKKGGKVVSSAETTIAGLPRTARFAKVLVKSSDQLSRLQATLYMVNGNPFSIEFDRPTKFADANRIDDIKVTILGPPFTDPDEEEQAAGDWPVESRE